MLNILEVKNLRKKYPDVIAVDGISFAVKKGICFGLLGPNGAGKTTVIEIIEGITASDGGTILYKDQPINKNFHKETGIQFQATALQEFLTVKETLKLFHKLYPHPAHLDEIIQECSLENLLSRDNRKLSGGQRQRLLVAIALINQPELLFMDEPTTGLDPQARRNFWNMVEKIKLRKTTIILTTHYMEEADYLCDEIIIMDKGKILASGEPKKLIAAHFKEVILELPENEVVNGELDIPIKYELKYGHYEIYTRDISSTLDLLKKHNISLDNLKIRSFNLEDLFLELTGSELRS
ncbi:MAG: ABC transporter ATP-binding protein [Candidatus Neomarinimicrobiota bacterium]|jgi:ABC-2 type transport system ATP-binding protein|nr:ABC transporter ATP-binding protein [Candidatus Neomarinimicrobiota bacterium]MEE1573052.1 ABC transporter ATP-binding protein [Candidatus Neomarinimicrobiota bacterium]|tara:strand:- start:1555 stop:2439 length:885 start_codon:yes stop_codon:yes gene_type:complete